MDSEKVLAGPLREHNQDLGMFPRPASLNKHLNYNFIMSTRGKEYARDKKDKYGRAVPEVVIPQIYQKNYRHQTKKNRFGN